MPRSKAAINANSWAWAARYTAQHGSVVNYAQLRGTGTLHFVPVGKVDGTRTLELAEYFRSKLGVKIAILPAIERVERHKNKRRQSWRERLDDWRHGRSQPEQLWAEEVLDLLKRAGSVVDSQQAVIVIGITDEEIVPRDHDWNFTHSWRGEDRLAIVSTAQMGYDPGDNNGPQLVTAHLRRMVLKDLGVLYYGLPMNNDPTSVLYNMIELQWAGDDFYESDLHPELMPWGRYGSNPCLTLVYDYSKAAVEPGSGVHDCDDEPDAKHPDRERFLVDLRNGLFSDAKTDFYFEDSPPILFQRIYRTRDVWDRSFGWGANHSYNSFLSTESTVLFQYVNLVFENGGHIRFLRKSLGVGFTDSIRFEADSEGSYHNAQLTWDGALFHLDLKDGRSYRYMPCGGRTPCYMIGFRDAEGKSLQIRRDGYLNLRELKSQRSQINFRSNEQRHLMSAVDHQGHQVSYGYDGGENVNSVRYPSGDTAYYTFDGAHQMLSASMRPARSTKSMLLFENQYDRGGRIVQHTQSNGATYRIHYTLDSAKEIVGAEITHPSGAITRLRFGGGSGYALWFAPAKQK